MAATTNSAGADTGGTPHVVEEGSGRNDNTFEDAFADAQSDRDSDHSDYVASGRKKRKRKSDKAQKAKPKPWTTFEGPPALPAPDLSDNEYCRNEEVIAAESDDDGLWSVSRCSKGVASAMEKKKKVAPHLSIQITGNEKARKLIRKLASVVNDAGMTNLTLPNASAGEKAAPNMDNPEDTTLGQSEKTGFFDIISPEIRLRIYKQLFKLDKPIEFGKSDVSASAQFLRTCKQAHEEGREILYGENSFHFTRDTRTRGMFWDNVWKEIGYKDIRRFLQGIGSDNIACLKHISFQLTDAPDNRTRTVPGQITDRRFVEDPMLQEIFNLIGANATLKTLALQFAGRAMVTQYDRLFLRALTEMKCYKLVIINQFFNSTHKCAYNLKDRMKQVMWVRDKKGNRVKLDEARKPVKMVYSVAPAASLIASWEEVR
ncbi:hypothetical protein A1O7_03478 [Cladophialophora yegresii CBS 114405]|uniref:Uncharacterized protein n=1 Tax=Cladophialophora yegresii CBS 114405 TaxID=1182544 RepID=W9W503_9EURO|nr:uncharacterized protein A1O7_03478 [Cladophialophora yegresii CBS 114405]EXJ63033.1 hypothetical protein A1O7_03478 [Cladophialophora yegresii CBS 114405]